MMIHYTISRLTTQLKIVSGINLQLPIVILKKSIISDMHLRITYKYINLQQNRVLRCPLPLRMLVSLPVRGTRTSGQLRC